MNTVVRIVTATIANGLLNSPSAPVRTVLLAEGTIEEKVLALQKKKAELFDSLMSDGGTCEGRGLSGRAFSRTVTAEDIRALLEG